MIAAGSDILAADLVHIRKVVLTAAENLTAGDRVGISNALDLYCARANTTSRTLTVTPNVKDNATGNYKTLAIGTDKYLLAYMETGTNNLKVVAISINRANMASPFTVGTPVTVTTTQVAGSYTATLFDVCQLNTDKFAVAYNESGAPTITRLVIGTIATNTITLGTPVNYDSSTNNVTGIAIGQISTDKAVVALSKTTNYRALCFTASGTVATIGSSAAMHANLNGVNLRLCVVATDKFCVSNDQNGYMQCATISGTTITFGTNVQYDSNSTADADRHHIWSPASNVVIVSYFRSAATRYFICATISGTTLSFGTAFDSGYTSSGVVLNVSSSIFYARAGGGVRQYGLSGTTITETKNLIDRLDTGAARGGFLSFGTYWMLIGHGGTSASYFIQGMSNNYIGIAQSTVSKDATVEVMVRGIDANQSGLVAGMVYLVDVGGALTQIADNNTINTLDDLHIVKAISATQIII